MDMSEDKKNHIYTEVGNIRITYVPANDRDVNADWSGYDVIRLQAYRNENNKLLHKGAELPIESPEKFIEFISALLQTYNSGRESH